MSLHVRSRLGSAVVGIIGVAYTVASLALLILTVAETWALARSMDFAIYLALVAAAAIGIWFVAVAALSLGIRFDASLLRRHATGHTGHALR